MSNPREAAGRACGMHARLIQQARVTQSKTMMRNLPLRCPGFGIFRDKLYGIGYIKGWNDMHETISNELPLPTEADLMERKKKKLKLIEGQSTRRSFSDYGVQA